MKHAAKFLNIMIGLLGQQTGQRLAVYIQRENMPPWSLITAKADDAINRSKTETNEKNVADPMRAKTLWGQEGLILAIPCLIDRNDLNSSFMCRYLIETDNCKPRSYEKLPTLWKLTHWLIFFLQASSQRQDNCGQSTRSSKETNMATKAQEKTKKEQKWLVAVKAHLNCSLFSSAKKLSELFC